MDISRTAFATLSPANLPAKLAFSALADLIAAQDGSDAHKRFVHVNTQQRYDRDVLRYNMALRRPVRADDALSESSTEIDTDVEDRVKPSGMIWTGCYTFDMGSLPADHSRGWTAGKEAPGTEVDFLLTTNGRQSDIRGRHVIFNFHQSTGYLYIVSRASSSGRSPVSVNGHEVPRGMTYSLNQQRMKIRLGTLEYVFEYTDYANSTDFQTRRGGYMTEVMGVSGATFDLTPTPSGKPRTIGDWTFSTPLGTGAFGRVHSATDSKGRIAAIKTIERKSRTADQVKEEIRILKELTALAEAEGAQDRILCLVDVIYPKGEEYTDAPFEEVSLVLQPCVLHTFADLVTARKANNR
jgi:hypothetical protein